MARDHVFAALKEKACAEKVDDVVLAVNELVVNALTHGSGIGFLTLSVSGDQLVASVSDNGTNCAAVVSRSAGEDEENGRGLDLVGILAREWFTRPNPLGGKDVVALFDLTATPDGPR